MWWNRHPDRALLTFLDVDSKLFIPETVHQYRDRDKHFISAINALQLIKTTFTPETKLGVILSMFKSITSTNSSLVWSMDALLPVCMYVVVRARVLQLGAELAMLQDLMETHLFKVLITIRIIISSTLVKYCQPDSVEQVGLRRARCDYLALISISVAMLSVVVAAAASFQLT